MAKTLAIVFGAVFVLVGVLGFVDNPLVGSMGLFETDTAHDLVHVVIGAVLLFVAFTAPQKSATWLKIFGVVYLLLAVLGFLMVPEGGELLGLVAMNHADHWLHVGLAIALLIAGVVAGKKGSAVTGGMPMSGPSM